MGSSDPDTYVGRWTLQSVDDTARAIGGIADAVDRLGKMAKAYDEDRPTSTLPGSGGTVSGTAVTDWVDEKDKGKIETTGEEGKVEFRKTEEFRKQQEE